MHKVQQHLVSWVAASLADVADIRPEDVQGTLLTGHAELADVRLRTYRITPLLPPELQCTTARCAALRVAVPFLSLTAQPITADVSGVELILEPRPTAPAAALVTDEPRAERQRHHSGLLATPGEGAVDEGPRTPESPSLASDDFASCQSSVQGDFHSCASTDGQSVAETEEGASWWGWVAGAVSSVVPPPITRRPINVNITDVVVAAVCGASRLELRVGSVVVEGTDGAVSSATVRGITAVLVHGGATTTLVDDVGATVQLQLPHTAGHTHVAVEVGAINAAVDEAVVAPLLAVAQRFFDVWAVPAPLVPLLALRGRTAARRWAFATAAVAALLQDQRARYDMAPEFLRQRRKARERYMRLLGDAVHDAADGIPAEPARLERILDAEEALTYADVADALRRRVLRAEALARRVEAPPADPSAASQSITVVVSKVFLHAPCSTVLVLVAPTVSVTPSAAGPGSRLEFSLDDASVLHHPTPGSTAAVLSLLDTEHEPGVRVCVDITPGGTNPKTKAHQRGAVHAAVTVAAVEVEATVDYALRWVTFAQGLALPVPPPKPAVRQTHAPPPPPKITAAVNAGRVAVVVEDWLRLQLAAVAAVGTGTALEELTVSRVEATHPDPDGRSFAVVAPFTVTSSFAPTAGLVARVRDEVTVRISAALVDFGRRTADRVTAGLPSAPSGSPASARPSAASPTPTPAVSLHAPTIRVEAVAFGCGLVVRDATAVADGVSVRAVEIDLCGAIAGVLEGITAGAGGMRVGMAHGALSVAGDDAAAPCAEFHGFELHRSAEHWPKWRMAGVTFRGVVDFAVDMVQIVRRPGMAPDGTGPCVAGDMRAVLRLLTVDAANAARFPLPALKAAASEHLGPRLWSAVPEDLRNKFMDTLNCIVLELFTGAPHPELLAEFDATARAEADGTERERTAAVLGSTEVAGVAVEDRATVRIDWDLGRRLSLIGVECPAVAAVVGDRVEATARIAGLRLTTPVPAQPWWAVQAVDHGAYRTFAVDHLSAAVEVDRQDALAASLRDAVLTHDGVMTAGHIGLAADAALFATAARSLRFVAAATAVPPPGPAPAPRGVRVVTADAEEEDLGGDHAVLFAAEAQGAVLTLRRCKLSAHTAGALRVAPRTTVHLVECSVVCSPAVAEPSAAWQLPPTAVVVVAPDTVTLRPPRAPCSAAAPLSVPRREALAQVPRSATVAAASVRVTHGGSVEWTVRCGPSLTVDDSGSELAAFVSSGPITVERRTVAAAPVALFDGRATADLLAVLGPDGDGDGRRRVATAALAVDITTATCCVPTSIGAEAQCVVTSTAEAAAVLREAVANGPLPPGTAPPPAPTEPSAPSLAIASLPPLRAAVRLPLMSVRVVAPNLVPLAMAEVKGGLAEVEWGPPSQQLRVLVEAGAAVDHFCPSALRWRPVVCPTKLRLEGSATMDAQGGVARTAAKADVSSFRCVASRALLRHAAALQATFSAPAPASQPALVLVDHSGLGFALETSEGRFVCQGRAEYPSTPLLSMPRVTLLGGVGVGASCVPAFRDAGQDAEGHHVSGLSDVMHFGRGVSLVAALRLDGLSLRLELLPPVLVRNDMPCPLSVAEAEVAPGGVGGATVAGIDEPLALAVDGCTGGLLSPRALGVLALRGERTFDLELSRHGAASVWCTATLTPRDAGGVAAVVRVAPTAVVRNEAGLALRVAAGVAARGMVVPSGGAYSALHYAPLQPLRLSLSADVAGERCVASVDVPAPEDVVPPPGPLGEHGLRTAAGTVAVRLSLHRLRGGALELRPVADGVAVTNASGAPLLICDAAGDPLPLLGDRALLSAVRPDGTGADRAVATVALQSSAVLRLRSIGSAAWSSRLAVATDPRVVWLGDGPEQADGPGAGAVGMAVVVERPDEGRLVLRPAWLLHNHSDEEVTVEHLVGSECVAAVTLPPKAAGVPHLGRGAAGDVFRFRRGRRCSAPLRIPALSVTAARVPLRLGPDECCGAMAWHEDVVGVRHLCYLGALPPPVTVVNVTAAPVRLQSERGLLVPPRTALAVTPHSLSALPGSDLALDLTADGGVALAVRAPWPAPPRPTVASSAGVVATVTPLPDASGRVAVVVTTAHEARVVCPSRPALLSVLPPLRLALTVSDVSLLAAGLCEVTVDTLRLGVTATGSALDLELSCAQLQAADHSGTVAGRLLLHPWDVAAAVTGLEPPTPEQPQEAVRCAKAVVSWSPVELCCGDDFVAATRAFVAVPPSAVGHPAALATNGKAAQGSVKTTAATTVPLPPVATVRAPAVLLLEALALEPLQCRLSWARSSDADRDLWATLLVQALLNSVHRAELRFPRVAVHRHHGTVLGLAATVGKRYLVALKDQWAAVAGSYDLFGAPIALAAGAAGAFDELVLRGSANPSTLLPELAFRAVGAPLLSAASSLLSAARSTLRPADDAGPAPPPLATSRPTEQWLSPVEAAPKDPRCAVAAARYLASHGPAACAQSFAPSAFARAASVSDALVFFPVAVAAAVVRHATSHGNLSTVDDAVLGEDSAVLAAVLAPVGPAAPEDGSLPAALRGGRDIPAATPVAAVRDAYLGLPAVDRAHCEAAIRAYLARVTQPR